jgi:Conserved protein/domain typically associated with flavoprotein oxygenases, DIM6/NTAB family
VTIDSSTLRRVLRPHASGVAVLTAVGACGPTGMTITSLTSVSAEPPLVACALADTSSTWRQIRSSRWYGIQLLRADQKDLAERFAVKGAARFAGPVPWHTGRHGVPLLDGCLSWLICSPHRTIRLGDHDLLVGTVEHAGTGGPGVPLVHVHGSLHPFSRATAADSATTAVTAPAATGI